MTGQAVVLHVSPHPDDEVLGAGMTLAALADRGWTVVNLLLSAGRSGDEARRLAEAREAARLAGHQLEVADGLGAAAAFGAALDRHQPRLVISPQPHDAHPAHEAVGRAVREVLEGMVDPPVWWMWGLWAELAIPTVYLPFAAGDLSRALLVLEAYGGELARNDYRRLVRGRAESCTVLGSERVFGFGSPAASQEPFAEVLTEAMRREGHWYAGTRRVVDLASPLGDQNCGDALDEWISDRRR